jgi:hypothetical protein
LENSFFTWSHINNTVLSGITLGANDELYILISLAESVWNLRHNQKYSWFGMEV